MAMDIDFELTVVKTRLWDIAYDSQREKDLALKYMLLDLVEKIEDIKSVLSSREKTGE